MTGIQLEFRPSGGTEQVLDVTPELRIGRGPHNDIVLPTGDVSWSHALFRSEGGALLVEDLGSRNGTFVDGDRIDRPTVLEAGKVVRIGTAAFRRRGDDPAPKVARFWMLEDVAASVQYPLHRGGFVVGGDEGDLQIPGEEPVELDVTRYEVLLGGEKLAIPWEGTLAGREVRIVEVTPEWTRTMPAEGGLMERVLRISLDPPRATLSQTQDRISHTVTAENRVSLLYFLANARKADLQEGVTAERVGWRTDAAISVGVWGRSGLESSRNRLNALTYRLRQELAENGLAIDLIQKDQGWARLAPVDIILEG